MSEKVKHWEIPPDLWQEWQNHGCVTLVGAGVTVMLATVNEVEEIVSLVMGQEALVGVGNGKEANSTISGFVQMGNGLVAKDEVGRVVAFQGLGLWPTINCCELRSALTAKAFTGKGINSVMKKLMIKMAAEKYPEWQFVGFTEATSKSRGIMTKLGFEEEPMVSVRQNLPSLGDACPPVEVLPDNESGCFLRCGGNCGCKVYLLNTNNEK
ncbi:MAG: hypothetical protein WAV41_05180 [Microgenomates group bacterium]